MMRRNRFPPSRGPESRCHLHLHRVERGGGEMVRMIPLQARVGFLRQRGIGGMTSGGREKMETAIRHPSGFPPQSQED